MVTEDYVSFETAKLLKYRGADFTTDNVYTSIGRPWEVAMCKFNYAEYQVNGYVKRPSLAMAMKWVREEKKIGIEININFNRDGDKRWYYEYGFCIFQLSGAFKKLAECDYDGYKTYEEACEAAIKYCLENLI